MVVLRLNTNIASLISSVYSLYSAPIYFEQKGLLKFPKDIIGLPSYVATFVADKEKELTKTCDQKFCDFLEQNTACFIR